jgi:NADH-quinone oxidoreductase subunit H
MLDRIIEFVKDVLTTPWLYIALIVHFTVLGAVAYLILLERKVASWVQDRIGPNRVGFGGLLQVIPGLGHLRDKHMMGLGQPLADGLKFIVKEDYRPKGVDRILFTMAPAIMILTVIVSIAVIPWGGVKQSSTTISYVALPDADATRRAAMEEAVKEIPNGSRVVAISDPARQPGSARATSEVHYQWAVQIADVNVGVLFILAFLSLAVYGVVVGGWASNNKYSFLGGLRATANMISYEIPLGLAILAIVVMFGTLDLREIVDKQATYWGGVVPAWNAFCQPVAFFLFLVCIHAEANRAPFDTAEAEQELVGGYHTEYSSMRFALFFLAEYAGMITTSAVCVALFLGGWHFPFVDRIVIGLTNLLGAGNAPIDPANPGVTTSFVLILVRSGVFFGKTIGIIFIFMWVRWSLPRFRFDQIMQLAWRALIPISLALLMVTAVVVYFWRDEPRAFMRVSGTLALALLAANVVLVAATMLLSRFVPAAPDTNRKIRIPNSRFQRTPLPGGRVGAPALNRAAAERLPVGDAAVSGRVGA